MFTHRLRINALVVLRAMIVLNQISLFNSTKCSSEAESRGLKVAKMCYTSEVTGPEFVLDTYEAAESTYTSCMCTLTTHKDPFDYVYVNELGDLNPNSASCGSQLTLTVPHNISRTHRCDDFFVRKYTFKTMTIKWSITDIHAATYNSDYCFYLCSQAETRVNMTLKCIKSMSTPDTTTTTTTAATINTEGQWTTATCETPAIKEYSVVAIVVPIVTSVLLIVIATTGNLLFYKRTRQSNDPRRHQINRPVENEDYEHVAIEQPSDNVYEVCG